MKKTILLFSAFFVGVYVFAGPPPFNNNDPAVKANFDDIYNRHFTHIHDGLTSPAFQRLTIGLNSVNGMSRNSIFDVYYSTLSNSTSAATFSRGSSKVTSDDSDATVEIWTDGQFSRTGLNIVSQNSNFTESPMLLMENAQPPSVIGDNGVAMAYYGAGYQIGVLGFSWVGSTTNTAKMQVYLQSGGNSTPVFRMIGTGTTGYAYALFGPPTIHTPASTLQVASDSGDVNSGIRIERLTAEARYNEYIDTDGDLRIREVDISTAGVEIKKASGQFNVLGRMSVADRIVSQLLIATPTFTPSAGATLHVESNTGDVDSGIRVERASSTANSRFNMYIDSNGDLQFRETDIVGAGLQIIKTSGNVVLKGVIDGSAAAAGKVGERLSVSSTVFVNMAASGIWSNVASQSITPGDWDCTGRIVVTNNGATVNVQYMAVSQYPTATLTDHTTGYNVLPARPAVTGADVGQVVSDIQFNTITSTTIYVKSYATYSVATPQVLGSLSCRRTR